MPPRPPPRQAGGGLSREFGKLLPALSHSPLGGLGSGSGPNSTAPSMVTMKLDGLVVRLAKGSVLVNGRP